MNQPEPGFYETKSMIGIADSLRRENAELKAENAKLRGKLMVADSLWENFKQENGQLKSEINRLRSMFWRTE